MVVGGNVRVRRFISITSKSALAATIAFILAACESKAPETVKPAATAPVFSSQNLAQRTIERRAIEAVIWGMPAVNYDLMYQAMVRDAKGAPNQIVYWSRLASWKNQTLTPNPDAIYLMPAMWKTNEKGLTQRPRGVVFAWIVITIACNAGLNVEGGAEGVGQATTSSVVQALLAMLVTNAILTGIFFFGA